MSTVSSAGASASSQLPSPSERYTRTLVDLTRTVWSPQCTFATAIGAICEAAAAALQVERVSIWHYDRNAGSLNCLDTWDAVSGVHSGADDHQSLEIDGDAYMETLQDVRSLDGVRSGSSATRNAHRGAFPDYIRSHRMHAVLDAPACLGGELFGAICHESARANRMWTNEEATFAASMGDFVAMAYEIDRRCRAEQEIEHLLLHDATTGLANRDYMVELIRQRLLIARDAQDIVAVIIVLIDSSSVSSSEHAPSAEDVMVRIALELRQLCSSEVDLARVHSNKFAFLLTRNAAQGTAVHLAERCIASMHALDWAHEETAPGTAVGIAFASRVNNDDAAVLLRQAEEAAQRAQTANNQSYEVFEPAHHDKLVERLRLERALRSAFARHEFEVYYQPEFDTTLGQWVAAEALLRWNSEGLVRVAGEFIEVAESSGMMLPLGDWALRQACIDATHWPVPAHGSPLVLRVNVSARQFEGESLVGTVASALRDSGLASERLCLEITETTLMGSVDAALVTLSALRATGVKLAIDDFGTGFASLIYLKRFPIDILKIDRSFVSGLPGSRIDAAIVSAIVGLAGALEIGVVAEGVESVDQRDALTAVGVSSLQGWLYAKAMTQTALVKRLKSVSLPA